ncbi:DUF4167 domain-containing protein [Stappia sp. WLB 29]|uniref:DUF4167 domain-containing protein n=1 Tax=Stappia sp. WLB 29 TaxID=2925220 RepID=UPI0020BF0F55|nr:DUF4167 domain-containing protein [Stappia sp. WLB 29]
MRPGNQSNNKRIRGRGGRKGPNPLSRTYESNGPDVKIRGTAHHVAEKYQQLARDAAAAGDRVMSENYLQHAEHYLRIIAAAQQSMHQPVVLPRGDEAEDEADELEERNERAERNDRSERSDRGERNDRSERNERRDRDRDRETGVSSGKPVMPVDAPQPFVDDIPVINTKSLPGESSDTDTGDEAGEDGDDRSRRRVRGARGRGLRRSRSAQGEGDGSDEAAKSSAEPAAEAEVPAEATEEKKPRARRAPRSRKPAEAEAAASEA